MIIMTVEVKDDCIVMDILNMMDGDYSKPFKLVCVCDVTITRLGVCLYLINDDSLNILFSSHAFIFFMAHRHQQQIACQMARW